jgi:deoxyribodipyrimidine photo-lyase
MHPESLFATEAPFTAVLVVANAPDNGPLSQAFVAGAAADAVARTAANFGCPVRMIDRLDSETIRAAASDAGVDTVVTACAPVGPVADALAEAATTLRLAGVELVEQRRSWDARFWPHARKGFFAFKENIPKILAQEQLC